MSRKLLEMAAELVQAQALNRPMSTDEIVASLTNGYLLYAASIGFLKNFKAQFYLARIFLHLATWYLVYRTYPNTTPSFEQQLSAYMNEPRVPRNTDIYAYWNNSQFRQVEPAAHKYIFVSTTYQYRKRAAVQLSRPDIRGLAK